MTIKGFQTEIDITELSDVDVSGSPGLSTGDALIFNTATQKFEHQPTPIFTGLDALPDVTLSGHGSPVITHIEKELLSYDAGISQWVDRKIPEAGLLAASTGLFSGGQLLVGTPNGSPLTGSPPTTTLITVLAGEGIVVDNYTDPLNPTYTNVSWSEFTDVAVTGISIADRTFIAIDSNGDLEQRTTAFTEAEHRDLIHIGTVGHASQTHVIAVRNDPHAAFDVNARLADLGEAIGAFNVTGNLYNQLISGLTINKTVGSSYRIGNNFHTTKKVPDITQDIAETALLFNYSYQDGIGGHTVSTSKTNTIVPGNYDDGSGTLASTPANDWQVQVIKHFPGGAGHRIEYGQTLYGTSAAAIAAIPDFNHIQNPAFAEGIARSYLVVRGSASDLSSASDAVFIEAGRFGASGAAGSTGGGVFTSSFESAALTITASTDLNAVHGLGVVPQGMQAFIRCGTAELGYAIDDEVEFLNGNAGSPPTIHYKGLYSNLTNIGWVTGASLAITNRTTGEMDTITLANWKLILRAYA